MKKSVATYSWVFILSTLFTTVLAQTEEQPASVEEAQIVDENLAETECVPQAQIDLMSDDNLEKLELPVCDEGEAANESDVTALEDGIPETQNEAITTENEVMTSENESATEESSFPSPNETLYEDQKPSD